MRDADRDMRAETQGFEGWRLSRRCGSGSLGRCLLGRGLDRLLALALFARGRLPECEGRGAGNGLLQLAVDWLSAQGWDELKLGTAAGTRADRFYATQGWRRDAMKNEIEVWYRLRRPALL